MRKKFLTIIIIFGMLFIFSMVSYAEEGIVETDLLEETELLKETELIPAIEGLIPSSEEIEYLSRCMDDYKIGGEVTVEILYNRFNKAKFLMGISEKGYMILYGRYKTILNRFYCLFDYVDEVLADSGKNTDRPNPAVYTGSGRFFYLFGSRCTIQEDRTFTIAGRAEI